MDNENSYGIYEDPKQCRKKKRPKIKVRHTFFVTVMLLVTLYATFTIGKNQWDLYQTNLSNQQLREHLRELEVQQQSLVELRDYVNSDDYIVFKARTELGLIGEGEKVVLWIDDEIEQ